ncbi:MAG: dUTP diphosphatase [Nanobdellota archaeon]
MDRQRGFEYVSRIQDKSIFSLPKRSTKHSAGYDMFSPESFTLNPGEKYAIKTGIKTYMQPDEALFIITRSGNGAKRRITLANNVALIDSDYYNNEKNEGEIIVTLVNDGDTIFNVEQGNRIAQCFFQHILLADDDSFDTGATRQGGLGSTGN